ncbi:MAG: ABC-F family ATP-binding cassette domain-containing protein [Anaerolineae bacterium]|nr:ABC-F family ATP-binding cassette domain-containing protein [Anaerolineae bacterium]
MSIIVGENLARAYGAQDVFSGVSISIAHGDHVGLVGPNGHGKTTLLKIIAGLEEPGAGTIFRQRGLRIGYLPQDPPPAGEETLHGSVQAVFAGLRQRQTELDAMAQQLSQPGADATLLARYGELQHAFEHAGGYTYETRIAQVLGGLGFQTDEYDKPLAHLSGGQRTRALLARLLLEEPDLLLLDEPTNHLDLSALEWLEETLLTWKGSMVVVAHDRYFLDKVVTKIWDMASGKLMAYRGNYSAYAQQREERIARQMEEWEEQQEQIAKTEDFIRRNMAGQRSREAKGRLRRLERFKETELIERPREQRTIRLNLTTDVRSGDLVLRTKGLLIGYDKGDALFRCPDLELLRGERASLIGPNGAGKTTFLKTILGDVPPLAGHVRLGASLRLGYMAQAHASLRPNQTVLDSILEIENLPLAQARSFLGRYLFSGDDVFKTIGVLSGGERSRIVLARLTLQGANFLLLDEPTNHLDIASQEILQEVLAEFPGTILLVSHDRYLVRALATQIWLLEKGELRWYKGGYDLYLTQRALEREAEKEKTTRAASQMVDEERERARRERRERKTQEQRALQAEELESVITSLEERLAQLEHDLASASVAADVERVRVLSGEYARLQAELHHRMEEWAALAEVAG